MKKWSHDGGTLKDIRSLICSLHTVLWENANWKEVDLADILPHGKVKVIIHFNPIIYYLIEKLL